MKVEIVCCKSHIYGNESPVGVHKMGCGSITKEVENSGGIRITYEGNSIEAIKEVIFEESGLKEAGYNINNDIKVHNCIS